MKRKASLSWKEKAVFLRRKQPFLFCLDIFHLEGSLFASQGIVATKLLEELGVEAQGLVVAPWVVHGEAGFCQVMGLDEGLGRCGRFDVVMGVDVEEAAQRVERHAGGVCLAVGRVTCDVGGADEDAVE